MERMLQQANKIALVGSMRSGSNLLMHAMRIEYKNHRSFEEVFNWETSKIKLEETFNTIENTEKCILKYFPMSIPSFVHVVPLQILQRLEKLNFKFLLLRRNDLAAQIVSNAVATARNNFYQGIHNPTELIRIDPLFCLTEINHIRHCNNNIEILKRITDNYEDLYYENLMSDVVKFKLVSQKSVDKTLAETSKQIQGNFWDMVQNKEQVADIINFYKSLNATDGMAYQELKNYIKTKHSS
jgi:hypothetical protein